MADYTGSDRRLAYLFANGGGGGGSCKVISGYYHDGSFYEDQSYTQIITGSEDSLYIDLDTTTLYLFDGSDYVEVQGGGGGGLAVTEEVLLDTPTSTNDWATPVSVTIDRDAHLMVSIEVALSDNPQIRNTVYNFTMEELKHNIRGSSYLMIPDESIHEGSTTYTHILGYVCLVDNTLYIHVPGSASLTVNRITAIRKTNIHTYSTTEQVVGTWIDGKPLYEQVIQYTTTPTSDGWTQIPLPTDCLVKDYNVYYHRENPDRVTKANFFRITSPQNEQVLANVQGGTMYVYISSAFITNFTSVDIILRYTKSTD